MTKEESHLLTKYLDKNNNGLIEEDEFTQKINFDNYATNAHRYIVSEQNFLDVLMVAMLSHIGEQRKKIEAMIKKYDDNGDLLIQYDEFHKLMSNLEPNMNNDFSLKLYKQTIMQQAQHCMEYGITVDNIITMIMEWRLGSFGHPPLENWLESKKDVYKAQRNLK